VTDPSLGVAPLDAPAPGRGFFARTLLGGGRASEPYLKQEDGGHPSLLEHARRTLLAGSVARAHGLPWDIFVVRADGSERRRVTYFYDDDPSAAWSPDGRWLVTFSSEALHVVALEGQANYCIAGVGGYGAVAWLP
jgi:hypothetical protein